MPEASSGRASSHAVLDAPRYGPGCKGSSIVETFHSGLGPREKRNGDPVPRPDRIKPCESRRCHQRAEGATQLTHWETVGGLYRLAGKLWVALIASLIDFIASMKPLASSGSGNQRRAHDPAKTSEQNGIGAGLSRKDNPVWRILEGEGCSSRSARVRSLGIRWLV